MTGDHSVGLGIPTPLTRLEHPAADAMGVELLVKRDDLIHPLIPGNKFRKLRYNLEAARAQGHDTILTFGGAFSNHLFATASAGALVGFETIGVVRGEEHLPLNPVLEHAVRCGMRLHYLDRVTYRDKHSDEVRERLEREFGDFYLLPEGGSNEEGVRGCSEIVSEVGVPFDYICCATGTGGTLAGLVAGLGATGTAVGFAVLKGGAFLADDVRRLVPAHAKRWRIETGYHFGGFARVTTELAQFMDGFAADFGIELDPIYTGKAFFGVLDLIERGAFPEGSRVVVLHTGGVPRSHWEGLLPRLGQAAGRG